MTLSPGVTTRPARYILVARISSSESAEASGAERVMLWASEAPPTRTLTRSSMLTWALSRRVPSRRITWRPGTPSGERSTRMVVRRLPVRWIRPPGWSPSASNDAWSRRAMPRWMSNGNASATRRYTSRAVSPLLPPAPFVPLLGTTPRTCSTPPCVSSAIRLWSSCAPLKCTRRVRPAQPLPPARERGVKLPRSRAGGRGLGCGTPEVSWRPRRRRAAGASASARTRDRGGRAPGCP